MMIRFILFVLLYLFIGVIVAVIARIIDIKLDIPHDKSDYGIYFILWPVGILILLVVGSIEFASGRFFSIIDKIAKFILKEK